MVPETPPTTPQGEKQPQEGRAKLFTQTLTDQHGSEHHCLPERGRAVQRGPSLGGTRTKPALVARELGRHARRLSRQSKRATAM